MKKTKLTNKDKSNIKDAVWAESETIFLHLADKTGKHEDIAHLSTEAIQSYIDKILR